MKWAQYFIYLMQPKRQEENPINERSLNFFSEPFDNNSRSRAFMPLKQDSMSMRAFYLPKEQARQFGAAMINYPDEDQLFHTNSFNFSNIPKLSPSIILKKAVFADKDSDSEQFQEEISKLETNKKKGLKFLAWALNKFLRKRKFHTNQIIDQCFKFVLAKDGDNIEPNKELKNLKRRIYDVINVMSSLGLVSKSKHAELYIEKVERKNGYEISSQRKQKQQILSKYEQEIRMLKKRIELKKRHRNELKIKYQNVGRVLDMNLERKEKIRDEDKMRFPIFFMKSNHGKLELILNKNRNLVFINFKPDDFVMKTQIQSLQYLFEEKKHAVVNVVKKLENQQKNKIKSQQVIEGKTVSNFRGLFSTKIQ